MTSYMAFRTQQSAMPALTKFGFSVGKAPDGSRYDVHFESLYQTGIADQTTDLDLSGHSLFFDFFMIVARSDSLLRLNLSDCRQLDVYYVLVLLEGCKSLVHLNVSHNKSCFVLCTCKPNPPPEPHFVPSSTLEVLDMSHCVDLTTEAVLIVLNHCTALRRVLLSNCPLVNVGELRGGEKWATRGDAVVLW
jgi:hypothetical protein